MQLRNWLLFSALAAIWGASFLWIKIAVREISPMMLATTRVGLGLAGLLVAMRVRRIAIPRQPRVWLLFLGTALMNAALPFPLISWAETRINSGMASVLNGTVPLFTNIIAHFCFHDERMSLRRAAGLACGLAGVVVLASNGHGPDTTAHESSLPGLLAMLAAVLCYASSNAYAKRFLRGQPPLLISTMTLLIAFLLMAPTLVLTEPLQLPREPLTWLALSWLGLLGVSVAYVIFYVLLAEWGPSRVSTIAYVFPFTGMLLGIIFLNEPPTWRLCAGAGLIAVGLWFVNRGARADASRPTQIIHNPKGSLKWPENLN
jgi:drug/metabolite transporter (DMT)-like permease